MIPLDTVPDCSCEICQSNCRERVGWFAPGEVAKAAALKGMTEKEFFDQYLAVDYHFNTENGAATFVIAPGIKTAEPGREYPFNPMGECRFFQNGLCDIHGAKPEECRAAHHDIDVEMSREHRDTIVDRWRNSQDEVVRLLGREPQLAVPTHAEAVDMMLADMRRKYGDMVGDMLTNLTAGVDNPEVAAEMMCMASELFKEKLG